MITFVKNKAKHNEAKKLQQEHYGRQKTTQGHKLNAS